MPWSARKLARASGLSHTSVQRIWAAHGIKPHLTETFKLSNEDDDAGEEDGKTEGEEGDEAGEAPAR